MKRSLLLLIMFFCIYPSFAFTADFRWARGKFDIVEKDAEDPWDNNIKWDKYFLEEVPKLTTLKIGTTVDEVPLDNLDKMTNYTIIFLHASGTPKFTSKEVANIREYLKRGGFIFAEDCINFEVGDLFFKGFKSAVEKDIFPGKKMEILMPDHPIYHSQFDLPKGIVCNQGPVAPGYGLHDEKGRLMIFLSAADIHCEWSTRDEKKTTDAYKMGINIIIYALTH